MAVFLRLILVVVGIKKIQVRNQEAKILPFFHSPIFLQTKQPMDLLNAHLVQLAYEALKESE